MQCAHNWCEATLWKLGSMFLASYSMLKHEQAGMKALMLYVWAVVNSLRMQMKTSGRWLCGNNRALVPCSHEGRKQASHEMLLQCRLWRQCLYLLLLPSPSHIVPDFAFLGGRYMLMQRRKFKARNSEDHANVTTNRAPKCVLLKLIMNQTFCSCFLYKCVSMKEILAWGHCSYYFYSEAIGVLQQIHPTSWVSCPEVLGYFISCRVLLQECAWRRKFTSHSVTSAYGSSFARMR